jgi:hypothetical protein
MTGMIESFKGKLKSWKTELVKGLLTHFPSASVDIHANGAFERYEGWQLCLITNLLQEREIKVTVLQLFLQCSRKI